MSARPSRAYYAGVSEKDWQTQVIDALHLYGWSAAHFRPAMVRDGKYATPVQADGAGFPDILAIHPKSGDHFVVELKTEYKQPTIEQARWLMWFRMTGWDAYVWRPSDVDAMLARVSQHPTEPDANALA